MSKEDVAVMKRFYDTYNTGDMDGFMSCLDPEIEWVETPGLPFPDKVVGLEELQGFFATMGDFWEEFAPRCETFIDAGDTVVIVGGYRGKHRASGTEVDNPYVHVTQMRNSRAWKTRFYEDTSWFAKVGGA